DGAHQDGELGGPRARRRGRREHEWARVPADNDAGWASRAAVRAAHRLRVRRGRGGEGRLRV
ncbi:hypothetical protein AVDCRST_MAG82-848, partial [uncultured Rubrobacteraceae bacterium]